MTPTEISILLAAITRFDNREVTDDDVHAWHIAIGDLDLADAELAVARHFGHNTDYLKPAHVRAGVKKIQAERRHAAGDHGPGHTRHVPRADPDDPAAYMAALRNGDTYDAFAMTPTGRPELPTVTRGLPGGSPERGAPSLKERRPGAMSVECPVCQAPIGHQCHTADAAGRKTRPPHGARTRAVTAVRST